MTTVCITGSTDGIGRATAALLAERAGPSDVLLVHARSQQRGAPVVADLARRSAGSVRLVTGDLAASGQVRELAAQLAEAGPLGALVHNAGVCVRGETPRVTADGLETTFVVNVLAPHLLTLLLRQQLTGGRVVWLGSGMARSGRVDPDRLGALTTDAGRAYADSKAADVALALGWARRLAGDGTASIALDPGWVPTKLASAGAPGDVADSAAALARCVTDPEIAERTGTYWKGRRTISVPPALTDADLQDRLLAACDDLASGWGVDGDTTVD